MVMIKIMTIRPWIFEDFDHVRGQKMGKSVKGIGRMVNGAFGAIPNEGGIPTQTQFRPQSKNWRTEFRTARNSDREITKGGITGSHAKA